MASGGPLLRPQTTPSTFAPPDAAPPPVAAEFGAFRRPAGLRAPSPLLMRLLRGNAPTATQQPRTAPPMAAQPFAPSVAPVAATPFAAPQRAAPPPVIAPPSTPPGPPGCKT